jgi:hypothetical protein
MNFSYSAVWDDTVRMLKANSSLLAALAGVFLFLPSLLIAYFLPQEQVQPDKAVANLIGYMATNIHWLILTRIVNMVGTLAMLILLFARGGVTVGGAIGGSLRYLPGYFLASVVANLMIGAGLLLFLIPGLYLFGRLTPLGPVVVAEDRRGPIDAIKRSFQVTKGKGWAILGLVLIVAIAGFILSFAVTAVVGAVLLLIAGKSLGGFLLLILQSAATAALSTVLVVLFAAIYRSLAANPSAAPRAAD